ncbi:protein of unknown function [Streptantibioticus cattleyicolor NRRL 8057 = DSM 46488]|nr:protein of unknown function [Streptantibioticus cattleyicolor NRRL 8057 = DSM 46488]
MRGRRSAGFGKGPPAAPVRVVPELVVGFRAGPRGRLAPVHTMAYAALLAAGREMEQPAFIGVGAAPHPAVLTHRQCPVQAFVGDRAATADLFGRLGLELGRHSGADREEQFRVLVPAGGTVTPRHDVVPSRRGRAGFGLIHVSPPAAARSGGSGG